MIFVTVGAQMPFDRLVRTADTWAAGRDRCEILAQIGSTNYRPKYMDWVDFLDPDAFRQRLFEADVIVTHAGMGTILTSLEFGKPVLVMPRRGDLNETRNDHQFDTTRAFAEAGRVAAAMNEAELLDAMDRLSVIPKQNRVASHASFQLLTALRHFIREGATLPVATPEVDETSPNSLDLRPAVRPEQARRKAA